MIDPKQDRELQARLLANHPAVKAGGVDPLWRWIALLGWITVAVLVAVTARGEGKLEIFNCQFSIANLQARNFPLRGADTLGNLSRVTLTSAEIRGGSNLGAWRNAKTRQQESQGRAPMYTRTLKNIALAGSNPAAPKLAERQTVAGGAMPRLASGRTMFKTAATSNLITERFMDALERVESGMDAGAVGDQGRSRGSFQFKAVAWKQVDTLRKSRGLARHAYRYGAHHRVTARMYAREYLGWLESYLTRALHRSPTHPELYAVWNLGPAGFRARGFSLARCPEHARRAAGLIVGELRVERAN